MLDLKLLRANPEGVRQKLARRAGDFAPLLAAAQELDAHIRTLEQRRSQLQAESNDIGKQVGQLRQDPTAADTVETLRQRAQTIRQELAELEPTEKAQREQLEEIWRSLPNLPDDSTPIGQSEADNVEVRRWGDEKKLVGGRPHWELGEALGWFDFERAVKVARTRFTVLRGQGAALERALIQWMLDIHTGGGYTEILPPLLVNSAAMTGTGQLPKFAEDLFRCAEDDLWLIPTAEVPVTNLYRDEILAAENLPIAHCAFTPCFRREAGSYGRDTRGLIRLHQFHKVELVKLTTPETSAAAHQALVADAEAILQLLALPYRVVELCTGDLGFGAAKCYDLEVWLPSANQYREISSCSNFGDFQARRANIRCKAKGKKGTEFVHTLNGSALAIGRTMAAILENYQQTDGTVAVPAALQPYLRCERFGS
ncbi:MAG TPA: serine--tRNA ligase [Cyanobacteria bacterium UBA8156]|jgi:seryl-tRNA synthetase|nr:serine--tRNA ligase [Cyanobacteria bacterium UBA8156]